MDDQSLEDLPRKRLADMLREAIKSRNSYRTALEKIKTAMEKDEDLRKRFVEIQQQQKPT